MCAQRPPFRRSIPAVRHTSAHAVPFQLTRQLATVPVTPHAVTAVVLVPEIHNLILPALGFGTLKMLKLSFRVPFPPVTAVVSSVQLPAVAAEVSSVFNLEIPLKLSSSHAWCLGDA
jgi:hypothetical protein